MWITTSPLQLAVNGHGNPLLLILGIPPLVTEVGKETNSIVGGVCVKIHTVIQLLYLELEFQIILFVVTVRLKQGVVCPREFLDSFWSGVSLLSTVGATFLRSSPSLPFSGYIKGGVPLQISASCCASA